jgi:hypothetical protein
MCILDGSEGLTIAVGAASESRVHDLRDHCYVSLVSEKVGNVADSTTVPAKHIGDKDDSLLRSFSSFLANCGQGNIRLKSRSNFLDRA